MANTAITAANVLPSTGASPIRGLAAVAITAGQVLYKLAVGTFGLADANGVAPANTVAGIAGNSAAAGQEVQVITADSDFKLGGTTSLGEALYLSATPGALCPVDDLATGMTVIQVTLGKSATNVVLDIQNTGAVVP